ncbi:MAG: GNAT family N-acetyltransferase [Spirochaetia bacterium]|nr:GNAT family N-acetyltransferase [Spirochaetia bacterium]
MIQVRKLTNKDLPEVYAYIQGEPEINLFIQGDLELYGLQGQNVTLYAIGENWDSILLKYYSDYILYSKGPTFNAKAVEALLARQDKIMALSAKESLLKQMQPLFPDQKFKGTYLCRCNKTSFIPTAKTELTVRKLTKQDAPALVALYLQIAEFAQPYRDHPKEKLAETTNNLTQGGVGFGLFEENKLICSAYTSATTTSGAMVVGVATLPAFRNRGYASALVSQLCSHCFESGLGFLCLFYDNPKAGAIYKKLGFEAVDRWAIMRF